MRIQSHTFSPASLAHPILDFMIVREIAPGLARSLVANPAPGASALGALPDPPPHPELN